MALTAPPASFAAGDTVTWTTVTTDFPATDGWALTWRLAGTGFALAAMAVADGADHVTTFDATATGALAVPATGLNGTLFGYAFRAGERFTFYTAGCRVLPNPASITGDTRGHAAKMLDAINALLEQRATKDQQSYRIGERELARIPLPDLLKWRDFYTAEARREAQAAALAQGRPRATQVFTRFGRG